MVRFITLVLVLLTSCAVSSTTSRISLVSTTIFDVLRYGAKGNGKTDDSRVRKQSKLDLAFIKAWQAACRSTPNAKSILNIPGKRTYLKRRVWLVTFEIAEEAARAYDEAARAYDEAAILMSGHNAKTNFPIVKTEKYGTIDAAPPSPATATSALSTMLSAKLRKCCKSPSPSLTCLRLDTESSHIGVWQKRAGIHSDSNWVMTVELGKKKAKMDGEGEGEVVVESCRIRNSDDEDKIALQMIEELLNTN
ncbi:hypothetical protein L1987_31613 [Smallanthus sonchifolius]|uniref:Uncharacterized protein n=1 Tax=Smallanthus sonchifolius TaxID=185202 RepID=A0ACB9I7G6_9ASTR|nr:hypothetical protein L1987_31613 [Smallanthus sonchifolius]